MYTVEWTDGYASGTLQWTFPTRAAARKAGNEWKRKRVDEECSAYDRDVVRKHCSFEIVPEEPG